MTLSAAQALFFIAIGAFFVPILSRRIGMPSAVGEIIYGMIVGHGLIGVVSENSFIEFMSQLGFAILMFGAGMEINFAPMRLKGSRLLSVASVWALVAGAVAALAAWKLGVGYWETMAVCSVSIGLASVFLKERKMSNLPVGQIILAVGLVGETASIIMLTVSDIHHQAGFSLVFFQSAAQFVGLFFLAYLLIRLFKLIIWWNPQWISKFFESDDPLEIGVRLAMALLFVFIAAASFFGVEAILGAFIAGALFGFIFQEREVITEKMNAIGQGFFVPFFFITVGSHFDLLENIAAFSWPLFMKLILLALIAKIVPSFLFLRLGLNWREILANALLLSAPLTLTVAIAEIGGSLGAISPELKSVLIVVAIFTALVCPYAAKLILAEEPKIART